MPKQSGGKTRRISDDASSRQSTIFPKPLDSGNRPARFTRRDARSRRMRAKISCPGESRAKLGFDMGEGRLAPVLKSALADPSAAELVSDSELEAQLSAGIARARALYPEVQLDPKAFARYVGERFE